MVDLHITGASMEHFIEGLIFYLNEKKEIQNYFSNDMFVKQWQGFIRNKLW